MKTILLGNLVKNIVIILILIFAYPAVQTSFSTSSIASDKSVIGNLLIAISLFSIIACFGNFAFTYEKVRIKRLADLLLAHFTTGLLMLLIGLSLEMTSALTNLLVGNLPIFDASLIILYAASVLYDFWDLKRAG